MHRTAPPPPCFAWSPSPVNGGGSRAQSAATAHPLLRASEAVEAARDGKSSPAKRGRGTMRSMVEGALLGRSAR